MIDPVTRIAAVGPSPQAGAEARNAPAPEAEAADAPSAPPEPLSLDVTQGAGGVFVYTLKDPGTGAVLAVIPREDVRIGRDGRNLDRRI